MGGQSFHLAVLQLLMCHGQLSDTMYALEVTGSCVGCFITLAVLQQAITQPVGCAFSAKCDLGR